ncbi:hypothetical protein B0T26DRAFT_806876 [Lasiosphaeria miniovina]|uniref:Uncharacterized protein n=1 Tax=Lasiosphaeria miniovina TaxID=1954250 RepID=A0AA40DH11_9PEZI|nr:uncharacterized protein B0T26DRAFT_806876 [Lasiosphaeria miniovina]KAK0703189.1 hypothetical protein B0T26DRAFT_806876 [Lasiosphaeria miniovina]
MALKLDPTNESIKARLQLLQNKPANGAPLRQAPSPWQKHQPPYPPHPEQAGPNGPEPGPNGPEPGVPEPGVPLALYPDMPSDPSMHRDHNPRSPSVGLKRRPEWDDKRQGLSFMQHGPSLMRNLIHDGPGPQPGPVPKEYPPAPEEKRMEHPPLTCPSSTSPNVPLVKWSLTKTMMRVVRKISRGCFWAYFGPRVRHGREEWDPDEREHQRYNGHHIYARRLPSTTYTLKIIFNARSTVYTLKIIFNARSTT